MFYSQVYTVTVDPFLNNKILDWSKLEVFADNINQNVESTGVSFVKGANERNEFFEKTVIHCEQVQTNKTNKAND